MYRHLYKKVTSLRLHTGQRRVVSDRCNKISATQPRSVAKILSIDMINYGAQEYKITNTSSVNIIEFIHVIKEIHVCSAQVFKREGCHLKMAHLVR